jgi:hypothetical protein
MQMSIDEDDIGVGDSIKDFFRPDHDKFDNKALIKAEDDLLKIKFMHLDEEYTQSNVEAFNYLYRRYCQLFFNLLGEF